MSTIPGFVFYILLNIALFFLFSLHFVLKLKRVFSQNSYFYIFKNKFETFY